MLFASLRKMRYPRIIEQCSFDEKGLLFEVTNKMEEWRAKSFDDEQEFLRILLAELTSTDVFFDIGACIGVYALHAARKCRQVYAFEPDPGFRSRLFRNIHLNDLSNVSVVPAAVSDQRGIANLYTDGINGRSPSLENLGQKNIILVDSIRIDDLIYEQEAPKPTIVKIDIEGAEFRAFEGAKNLLSSEDRPRLIFIEIHPRLLSLFGNTPQQVLEFLDRSGYRSSYQMPRDTQYHYIFEAE